PVRGRLQPLPAAEGQRRDLRMQPLHAPSGGRSHDPAGAGRALRAGRSHATALPLGPDGLAVGAGGHAGPARRCRVNINTVDLNLFLVFQAIYVTRSVTLA